MSSVLIKGPATGQPVPTGIEVESSVFRQLPKTASQMTCPACGQEHVWATSSAWLEGEPYLVRQSGEAA